MGNFLDLFVPFLLIKHSFTMEGVHSLEQANKYLQQSFMPYFNELFGYDADYVEGRRRKIGSAFVECSSEQIRTILAVLCERSVNKGGSIQMDSKFYALVDHTGRRIALPYHAKVTVARLLDGSLYATRKEQCYALQRIPERYAFSPQVDPEQEKPSTSLGSDIVLSKRKGLCHISTGRGLLACLCGIVHASTKKRGIGSNVLVD